MTRPATATGCLATLALAAAAALASQAARKHGLALGAADFLGLVLFGAASWLIRASRHVSQPPQPQPDAPSRRARHALWPALVKGTAAGLVAWCVALPFSSASPWSDLQAAAGTATGVLVCSLPQSTRLGRYIELLSFRISARSRSRLTATKSERVP